jgi:hypothetical protein
VDLELKLSTFAFTFPSLPSALPQPHRCGTALI